MTKTWCGSNRLVTADAYFALTEVALVLKKEDDVSLGMPSSAMLYSQRHILTSWSSASGEIVMCWYWSARTLARPSWLQQPGLIATGKISLARHTVLARGINQSQAFPPAEQVKRCSSQQDHYWGQHAQDDWHFYKGIGMIIFHNRVCVDKRCIWNATSSPRIGQGGSIWAPLAWSASVPAYSISILFSSTTRREVIASSLAVSRMSSSTTHRCEDTMLLPL